MNSPQEASPGRPKDEEAKIWAKMVSEMVGNWLIGLNLHFNLRNVFADLGFHEWFASLQDAWRCVHKHVHLFLLLPQCFKSKRRKNTEDV